MGCRNVIDRKIIIDKLIPGGQALATLPDGKKIFLWNALPGETVAEYKITKNKSHFAEAIATKIENPSSHRIEPKDVCFLSTSPWQIMDYDYELVQKTELVKDVFRQNDLEPNIKPILSDNHDFCYRNKMEYALFWDKNEEKIKLAFHARGSHQKIPIESSSIERPEIWQKANEIIRELNERHEEARKYQSLLLRCDQQGNVSGGLYENHQPHPKFDNLSDTILDQKYSYSPNGFFQINLPVYEMALKEIAKHIATDKVLDLYAGVGTIGLSVARDKNLTLVECDKYAYAELERNAEMLFERDFATCNDRRNKDGRCLYDDRDNSFRARTNNISAFLSKSEDALNYITPDETVIVDPPRAGCHAKLLEKLLEQTPPTIIYLSCNPATQARDVKILSEKYHITEAQPFNFFPRTPHIENLIILQKT